MQSQQLNSSSNKTASFTGNILSVLFCFFVMGFVDFVGIATNYVKIDFSLSDTLANTLPMMVFVWFAVFSIPTGILMNKIGRKSTVLISLVLTLSGLLLPTLFYSFPVILVGFGLIGIGNTIMQTSLNPLVTNIVKPEKLTSFLTLGQFVKAIASFLGPILAAFMAKQFDNWLLTFYVFAATTILSGIGLFFSNIPKEKEIGVQVGFKKTLALLKDKYILVLFLGILFIVGIDVGLNTSLPKLLIAKTNMPLEDAGMGTTCYFIARTIGALIGAILLSRIAGNKFLRWTILTAIAALAVLLFIDNAYIMFAMIFIIGLTCANVFSIIFSYALRHKEEAANEISSLMIMGVAGGALIMPVMGGIADWAGQTASISVLFVCMAYLWFISSYLKS